MDAQPDAATAARRLVREANAAAKLKVDMALRGRMDEQFETPSIEMWQAFGKALKCFTEALTVHGEACSSPHAISQCHLGIAKGEC